MAPTLYVQDDRGNEYPGYRWATRTDTKMLCQLVLDQTMINVIAHALRIDVSPLLNIMADEIPEEQSHMFETWEDYETSRWQVPNVLFDCVNQLCASVGQRDNVYAELEKVRQSLGFESLNNDSFEDVYFVEGAFRQDVADLAQVIKQCQENTVQQVRLLAI